MTTDQPPTDPHPIVRLPEDPSLEHLRTLARRLQRAVRAGDAAALALVRRRHPDGVPVEVGTFALSAAQLVVAREAGFPSWPRLRAHLDLVTAARRDPDAVPAGPDPADELCRLGCLVYSAEDGPDRWAAAGALLAAHPDLPARSVFAAAAAADPDALAGHLAADPAAAGRAGGPHGWAPLLYLTYSRLPGGDPLRAARLLLDAGADPDAGYLWHGLVPPFTALTGVFGEGEQGPGRQPRHPRSLALARLLLDAGAEANDGQTLYNRMFRPDDDALELLFSYGLGRGDGGVWRARLGGALPAPAAQLARPLTWAAAHGFTDRVRLLLGHGVDPEGWTPEGRAVELAAAGGHVEIVELLVAAGAPRPRLAGVAAVVAAVLAGDEAAVRAAGMGALEETLAARPALVAEAVEAGRGDAVELAARLGFDVSAPGGGQTALHSAVWDGDLPLVRRLVGLGADTTVRDGHFGGTPLDWARHAQRADVADYLAPLTPAAPDDPAAPESPGLPRSPGPPDLPVEPGPPAEPGPA